MWQQLLDEAWTAAGGPAGATDRLTVTGPAVTLPLALPVTAVGVATVGTSLLAATDRPVAVDTRQLAIALRSERYVRLDGVAPAGPFDPLSAFHRTADGWIRLHANYPWHRSAARRVLGLPDNASTHDVWAAIADRTSVELETALHTAGGVGAVVRTAAQWTATEAGRSAAALPLVEYRDLGVAPPRPARRPRVLDLTRVIAGPVATRTLAAHGADVLRVDPPDRPEIPLHYWDTLPGKRSALLDLGADPARLTALLAGADVVVAGYRPGALDRFGLAPEALAERYPGLVVVTLSVWGPRGPWDDRRGFDSLVQAATGIALVEGDARHPGALPAQVLDHATGYLGAAAVTLALARQRRAGDTPHIRLSLVGTAHWLLRAARSTRSDGCLDDAADVETASWLLDLDTPSGRLTLAAPPGTVHGRALHWPPPTPAFGASTPVWDG